MKNLERAILEEIKSSMQEQLNISILQTLQEENEQNSKVLHRGIRYTRTTGKS